MIKIYKITNPKGKTYIGQTKNVYKRKQHYKRAHCKQQYMLYNSIIKYGWNNHIFEVIDKVPIEQADDKEIYYIDLYKSYHTDGGLNLTRGGFRPKHTQETKDKLSEMFKGAKHGRAKKLYQYTADNQFVKEWDCIRDIQRELGYVTTWLCKAAKNNKIAYGYRWFYKPLHEQL